MGIREEVAERFPSLIALLNEPEIGGLLTRAVQETWSPGKFQSEFIASNWFRSQSESQRRWWVMGATDPGEAKLQRGTYRGELTTFANQLGVSLTGAQATYLTELALAQGHAVDSAWMRNQLVKLWSSGDRRQGQIGVLAQQVRAISEGEYFESMTSKRATQLAFDIVRGNATMEEYQMRLQARSADRFPHLKDRIASGQTLAQIVEPYRNIVADELELGGASAVNMRTPLWRQLLGIRDPKSGKTRLPTESDVIRLARSQPQWWKTARGQEMDAGMASTLMNVFGARKTIS